MTPILDTPPGSVATDTPRAGRMARYQAFALSTWAGRFLLGGVLVKAVSALAQLFVAENALIGGLDILGGVLLVAGAVLVGARFFLRAKRQLLWRVRRKLILSYIFIGVVPALLIVSFFLVSGLILFLNVASYLVKNGFTEVTNDAYNLARIVALEVQRGPGPSAAAADAILEQREITLLGRYPGASIALVPTGPEPCVGASSASPRRAPAAQVGPDARRGQAEKPIVPVSAGPWAHEAPPTSIPSWVSCSGFGGGIAVAHRAGESDPNLASTDPVQFVLRGVGFPDMDRPTYAIVVDIPKNDAVVEIVRDQTSIKVGAISSADGSMAVTGITSPSPSAPTGGDTGASGKRRFRWVAFLDCTNWADGRPANALANIQVNIADIYDRVAAAQARPGTINYGSMLLLVLFGLAVLFLFIEAAALVMGLALARSITGSVHELFTGTERVREGDFSHRIRVQARDQLGELADSFNQMTASIEDLLRQAEEKKRLEEELRIAREIQMSLLPRGQFTVPGLSLTALCVPAREVGGDYYDFIPLDGDRLAFLIADVSGKGTSAALYMAELKGVILTLSQTCQSPRQLLIAANKIIAENLDSRSFITMSYGIIDVAKRRLTFARAGHTPLIYRPETPEGDGDAAVRILTPDGLVLGLRLDSGALFERLLVEETLPLHRGDVLLLFTDGISEAMNPGSDLFGEGRLGQLVAEHGHLAPEELRERILREIESFVAGAAQHDDMTMILMKIDDFVPGAVGEGFGGGRD